MESKTREQKTVIFLHIPKTGGTTLKEIIGRHYRKSEIYDLYKRSDLFTFNSLSNESLNKIKLLRGHITFGFHRFFNSCSYITILRDPIKRVISNYYYILNSTKHELHNKLKFGELDIKNLSYLSRNSQTRLIAGLGFGLKPTPDDLNRAKKNLEKYFSFVGITEMFDESLIVMKEVLGYDKIFYKKRNVTKNKPSIKEISDDVIEEIKSNNELDIELYQFAKQLFKKKVSELGEKFYHEMNNFKMKNNQIKYLIENLKIYGDIIDVGFVSELQNSNYKKIIIVGAGEGGRIVYKFLKDYSNSFNIDMEVVCFFDNDKTKWDKKICGINILKPNIELINEVDKVVISSTFCDEIEKQLLTMGINENKISYAIPR